MPGTKSLVYVSQLGESTLSQSLNTENEFLGAVVTLFGQTLRSLAMIQASTNFSHIVVFKKRSDHILVTDGIYA